jgi:hypothetical protein
MLETIKKIDESIEQIENEIKDKRKIIDNLINSKNDLLKISDICPMCYGHGEIYKPSNDGDPYHKSSDDWDNCPRCKGKGKYNL